MRRAVSLILVVMLVMVMAAPVFAGPVDKFKDGIEQFVTSPMNFVDNVKEEYEAAELKPLGAIGGAFKGVFYTLKDAGGGLINAVTFFYDNE